MHNSKTIKQTPIIAGILSLTLLTGCQGMFQSSLSEDDQVKFDTMSTTIAEQSQHISQLESNIEDLSDKNKQLGREVYHLREAMDEVLQDVDAAKEAAVMAERRSMLARGQVAIHLASYRNMETTLAGWKSYTDKYGDAFTSLVGVVSVFTSGSGDEFYRLKAGPFASQEAALEFCKTLEARDDYCNVDKFEGDIID